MPTTYLLFSVIVRPALRHCSHVTAAC